MIDISLSLKHINHSKNLITACLLMFRKVYHENN
nr:MAG TPA: hypothetical protein [Caudoviricetes sp.]